MEKQTLINLIEQGLSTWKIAEALNTSQPNIRYWLKKHELKTERVVKKLTNTKLCPKCNTTKNKDDFYKSTKSSSYCKACILVSNAERRRIVKQQAIEYLGGGCSKCGYDKCSAALDFHHLDPTIKDKDYSLYKTKFDDRLKELDKCVLLCANCHREEHHLLTTNI